jgi:hypothetical protein
LWGFLSGVGYGVTSAFLFLDRLSVLVGIFDTGNGVTGGEGAGTGGITIFLVG